MSNVVKVWLLVQHVEQSQSGEARVVSKVEPNPGPFTDKIAKLFLFEKKKKHLCRYSYTYVLSIYIHTHIYMHTHTHTYMYVINR